MLPLRFNQFLEGSDAALKSQVRGILNTRKPKSKRGLLIVFEGCDGVGKSTQFQNTVDWIEAQNYDLTETKWNSSKLLHDAISDAKEDRILSPMLYCLLHAADMLVRYEQDVLPALEMNRIVVADRWVYTSIVRDKCRGVDVGILDEVYKGFQEPDILFHCVLPIHKAFTRLVKDGERLGHYGIGMDLNLADNKEDNYVKYENMLDKHYKEILPLAKGYHKLDMDRSIDDIFIEVKQIIRDKTGISKYSREDED